MTANSNLGRPDPQPNPQPNPQRNPQPTTPSPAPQAADAMAGVPVEIAGYRIQRVLGSGGMATVFAAMQSQPRRIVALKVMKPALAGQSKTAHRRFRREIEILGKLHHPYIAQVYGAGVHDEDGPSPLPYFVMEFVLNAKTILEHIAAKNLTIKDRLKLFAKVCAGVDHAHKHKVIHRDLKPSNILIDEYGEPKIIDFGVALANEIDVESDAEAAGLIGTLSYMSPEQVSNQPVDLDARCDVYSLGALLYKILTGRSAHDLAGKSVGEAARIIREQTPAPPSRFKPDLRGDLDEIILKAMSRLPANRYRNAGSLGRDVVRHLNHRPIHARRAGLVRSMRLFVRRHRAAVTAGLIATIVIGCGLSIIAFERWRLRHQPVQIAATQPAPLELPGVSATGGGAFGATLPDNAPRDPYELNVHTGRVTAMAMTQALNGPRLASVSVDHKLLIWDLLERQLTLDLNVLNKPLTQVSLNFDGSRVSVAAGADPIQIIDIEQSRIARTIGHQAGEISALDFSPDGSRLAFAGEDFALHIVDLATEQQNERVLRSSSGVLTCVAWSADGAHVVAGSKHGPLYLWNLTGGGLDRRFAEAQGELIAVAFSSQQSETSSDDANTDRHELTHRVLAVSRQGTLYMWKWSGALDNPNEMILATNVDVRSGGPGSRVRNGASSIITAASFNKDCSRLFVAVNGEVIQWNTLGAQPKPGAPHGGGPVVVGQPIQLGDDVCTTIAIEPHGSGFALGMSDGGIRFVPLAK